MPHLNNKPLVSINIPIYKCEKYVYRCLESVKNQTYQNIEIILVNDCTPDNSMEIIEKYLSDNPLLNFKIFHLDRNYGLSVVRNKAIEESKGKYIYMLDSDDYITNNCIEKLVENSEKYNCEITVSESICEYEDSGEKKQIFKLTNQKDIIRGNNNIFKAFVDGNWPIIGPNKLYLKDFITKHNLKFIEGLFSQDELWGFHCAEKLESISFIHDITYIYYMNSGSTIFNRTKRNFENYLTILNYFNKSYEESTSNERKKLIKNKMIHFKEMIMIMQWRTLKNDITYLKENLSKMKKTSTLNVIDYLNPYYSLRTKRLNFYQNLPNSLAAFVFIKRYG